MKHLTTLLNNLTPLKKNPTGKSSRLPPIITYKSTLLADKIRVNGFNKDFKKTLHLGEMSFLYGSGLKVLVRIQGVLICSREHDKWMATPIYILFAWGKPAPRL